MKVEKVFRLSIIGAIILTFAIYLSSFFLSGFRAILVPDQGAAWYYWKLPEFDFWATFSAWAGYVLHQVTAWVILFKLKMSAEKGENTLGLSIKLLIVNIIFTVVHIVQSLIFYDGLAQTTPVFSSQGSVIIMLVMILIMLNSRRGLFFGKKAPLPKSGVNVVRQVHGIYISWALIFTFWFHPTEGTVGHLLGFFFMFLLMIQFSLAYTKIHTNIKWITFLEGFVAIHGAAVAIVSGNNMWQMFFFGFAMIFVVTGIYGITKSKRMVGLISGAYIIGVLFVYSGVVFKYLNFSKVHQIIWIPAILYALVFVFAIVLVPIGKGMKLVGKNKGA